MNGGYIEEYELDIRRKLLAMRVDVLDGDTLSSYDLRFELLSHLAYNTESRSDPEARLQLTELWLDAVPENSPTEEWSITISIYDLSHIRLRCSMISVDGQMLK
ncbi:MAG: hypothetical protein H0T68_10295 [Gemmatimonadales bacterium]|nr:hypothetical protein [Gemmatimonadales bacterium]